MSRDDLDYVSLVDYKAGIYSKYSLTVGTTLGKDGAARKDFSVTTLTEINVPPVETKFLKQISYSPLDTFEGWSWNHGLSINPYVGRLFLLFISTDGVMVPSNEDWTEGTGYWWSDSLSPVIDFCGTGTYITAHLVQIEFTGLTIDIVGEGRGIELVETQSVAADGTINLTTVDETKTQLVSLAFSPTTDPSPTEIPFDGGPDIREVGQQTTNPQLNTYGSGATYGSVNYGGTQDDASIGYVHHVVGTFQGDTIIYEPVPDSTVTVCVLQFSELEVAPFRSVDTISTYGCYGDPDGGLRPLPRLMERHKRDINTTGANKFAQPAAEIGILDIGVVSPIISYDPKVGVTPSLGAGRNWFTYAADSGANMDQPDQIHVLMYYTSKANTSAPFANNANWANVGGRPITEWRLYRLHERTTRGGMLQNLESTTQNPNNEVVLRRAMEATYAGQPGTTGSGNQYTPVTKATGETYNINIAGGRANNTTANLYPSGSIAIGRTSPQLRTNQLGQVERSNEPGKIVVVASSDHTHGWTNLPLVADDGTEALYPSLFGIYPDPLDDSLYSEINGTTTTNTKNGGSGRSVFPRRRNKPVSPATENPADYHQHRLDRHLALAARFLVAHNKRFVGVLSSTYLRNRANDYGAYQTLDSDETIAYSEYNAVIQLSNNELSTIPANVSNGDLAVATGTKTGKYRSWTFWKANEVATAGPDEQKPGTPGTNALTGVGDNTVILKQNIYDNNNPSGIGTMISHGSDMLVVKNRGGAILLSGALDSARAIPLPKVESTQHAVHHGVMTPLGYLYGSRTGAFIWNNGDTSERVSTQLDGFFWDPEHKTDWNEARHNSVMGRFGYNYPFAYLPNGWIMDVRTGGWFRLNDPEDPYNKYKYMFYAPNAFGDMYAVRAAFSDNENENYPIDVYSSRNGLAAQQYRWISQPLQRTINRTVMVEEAVIIAEGTGYVDVTVHGWDAERTTTRFWIDSPNQPIRLSSALSLRSSEITVQLDVVSARENFPDIRVGNAPTIHAVHIGMRRSHQEPHI